MSDAKKTASKKTASSSSSPEANRTDSPTPDEVKEAMAERATGGHSVEADDPFPTTADLNPAFHIVEGASSNDDSDEDKSDDDKA